MTTYKSNTNYVFTFGRSEVGKSSFLASLCDFIQRSDAVRLRKNTDNHKAHDVLRRYWLERFREQMFPPRSLAGEIYEIDVGIQKMHSQNILPLTFLEMSGEDLKLLDSLSYVDDRERFRDMIIGYLNSSDLILLVTSPSTCKIDDYTFDEFFEILEKYKIKKHVGLIITKIDQLDEGIDSVEKYVNDNMPAVYKWLTCSLRDLSAKVFVYSTGVPDNQDPYKIKKYNHKKYALPILRWIYDVL